MPRLDRISPMVPVSNLDDAVTFFSRVLGFEVGPRLEGYAFVSRDDVAIRLIAAAPGKDLHDPNSQQHCYIDVTGIDALYEELKPELDGLPDGRVRPPFDTGYGQREFHVIDQDALLISFGERLADVAS